MIVNQRIWHKGLLILSYCGKEKGKFRPARFQRPKKWAPDGILWTSAISLAGLNFCHLSASVSAKGTISTPPHTHTSFSNTHPSLFKIHFILLSHYWRQALELLSPPRAAHFLLYGNLLFCPEQVLLFKNTKQNSFSYYKKRRFRSFI